MIELRDYQKQAVDIAIDFMENGNPRDIPIIVAPTAAGKSIYIGHIAHHLKKDVLVIQPSKELLEQNYEKYKLYGGEASIYSASLNTKEIGDVTFATIGSIKEKASDFTHVRYILIDECHLLPPTQNSMFVSFLQQLPGVKILGFTATAFRLKSYVDPFTSAKYSQINLLTRERPRFFNKFLHITQIKELYEKGYLAPVTYVRIAWNNGELKYNSTGAEFSDDSVDREIKQQMVIERLPAIIKKSIEKGRKHRLVFVKSVSDAIALAKQIPESACVHAETKKKDRALILENFKNGRIKTIFNVGVLTIGFDFPALDTILIARPTMSLSLYMQMIGRGIRKHPGKKDCVVVDMCGNLERFTGIEKIEYAQEETGLWVLQDDRKQLSGVRLK